MFKKVLYAIGLQQRDACQAALAQVPVQARHWKAELYMLGAPTVGWPPGVCRPPGAPE